MGYLPSDTWYYIYFTAKTSQSNADDTQIGEEPEPAPPQPPKEDGVLLYLAIKVKDEFKDEEEVDDKMRKLFRNDFNNNPGTIQKKVKKSVFKTIINEKGEAVQVEVLVNKRKVTRNIIDEKTGRVMEVETEVTTDDSDEDVMNPDGSVVKKPKRKMRRGKTGGQTKEGGEPRRRRRRLKSVRGMYLCKSIALLSKH